MSHSLDLYGLKCPLPVLKVRRAMQGMQSGETLEVQATDPGIKRDLPDYCTRNGHTILSQEKRQEVYIFLLKKA